MRAGKGVPLLLRRIVFLILFFPLLSGAYQAEQSAPDDGFSGASANKAAGMTPERVVTLVEEACKLFRQRGKDCLGALSAPDSRFRFGDTYLWVYDLMENRILIHPHLSRVEDVNFLYLRDITGKLCFAEFNQVAVENGNGWVEYYWPRPGKIAPELKTTYVKLCRHNGRPYVLASGIYEHSKEDVENYFAERATGRQGAIPSLGPGSP